MAATQGGVTLHMCTFATCPYDAAGRSLDGHLLCERHLASDHLLRDDGRRDTRALPLPEQSLVVGTIPDIGATPAPLPPRRTVPIASSSDEATAPVRLVDVVDLPQDGSFTVVAPEAELEALRVGDLLVDMSYQRTLNKTKVAKYAAAFKPLQVGILEVSRRDGNLYLVDGQHRAATLLRMYGPDATCAAMVYDGLTREMEAERFDFVNTKRTQVTPIATWKANRIAGHADVRAIDTLLAVYDLKVAEQIADGVVQCVGELRTAYEFYGINGLEDGIHLLNATWGTQRDAYRTSLVASMTWVCATYLSALDRAHLVTVLKEQFYSAITLYKAAKSRQAEHGGSVNANVTTVMVEAYNRRASKKLPLPADVRPQATKRVNDVKRLEQLLREATTTKPLVAV